MVASIFSEARARTFGEFSIFWRIFLFDSLWLGLNLESDWRERSDELQDLSECAGCRVERTGGTR
jgi:hypothetical protein